MEFGLIFRAISLFSLYSFSLFGSLEPPFLEKISLYLHRKPLVSEKEWIEVRAYLLSENHPVKEKLDTLFAGSRHLLDVKSLKKAGFNVSGPRKFTKLIVATHPEIPGYVIKLYVDAQRPHKKIPEQKFWIMRAQGAALVRQEIEARGWHHFFKVPDKWLYYLPENPAPPSDLLRKRFILVETDMELYPDQINVEMWKSAVVSHQLLDALRDLLIKVGLHDCVKPDNIPFSVDGRIAFVDTQTFNERVNLKEFTKYLSPDNQGYWKQLILNKK